MKNLCEIVGSRGRGWRFTVATLTTLGCGCFWACSKTTMTTEIQTCPSADGAAATSDAAPTSGEPDGGSLAGLPGASAITPATLYKSPLVIEGLTADGAGNFYAAGRGGTPCAVWRVVSASGTATVVGNIAAPCSPNGLAFNAAGDLFIGDGANIFRLTPSEQAPPMATVFATNVPGANGLAFDRRGVLWASDGVTGQGRVWKVATDGTPTEAFRVPPLANDVNTVVVADAGAGTVTGGVGRDVRALPPGALNLTPAGRAAADTLGSVAVVANGLAFSPDGNLFVADTARGAIWKVTLDAEGNVTSPLGCDTTFAPSTLCLENVFVAHPMLEGLDGIAFDTASNIWGTANERNAIVVVTAQAHVREVFRNPADPTSRLRNGGPLEFPTSPFLLDHKLCVTQSDTSRRDNSPNSGGEVGPGIAGPLLGKISCLDITLPQPGLVLPVR
jgi:sugar lactone lactonase YvrE